MRLDPFRAWRVAMPAAVNPSDEASPSWIARRRPRRIVAPVALFLLTLLTTSFVGSQLSRNFLANRPAFNFEEDLAVLSRVADNPAVLWEGLPFAVSLLTILLAHEMGHWVACRYHRLDATLPYFLPAPTFIGTLGAFIRIRSPIYTRRALFDVGVSGPIAGFIVLLPFLGAGLAMSRVIPGIAKQGDLEFGEPLLLWLGSQLVFPGVPAADIALHPIARAAWVGMLATALNLLPIGQLDGGHILYAFFGSWHRLLSRLFVAALIPIGIVTWYGWIVWAVLLFFFALRHPTIIDPMPLSAGRRALGVVALLIFVLCICAVPVRARGGF